MTLARGATYAVLFVVLQCLWRFGNCQPEVEITGTIELTGSDDNWDQSTEHKIRFFTLEPGKRVAPGMTWIQTSESPDGFNVFRLPKKVGTSIQSLELLQGEWLDEEDISFEEWREFKHLFAEIIQKAMYRDIRAKHPDWIVIPFGISLLNNQYLYSERAHIDFPRDVPMIDLLQRFERFSEELMEFLAKDERINSAALTHYNGNVEQYAIEELSLDHLMNIWIPTKPVQAWPLAFTPAHQCGPDRTKIEVNAEDSAQELQYLLRSETTRNDWYTRWNMQPDEVYVWNSRTVAHVAVKIGDGTGERSAIACRLLIAHPKEDRSRLVSSLPDDNTLCYTKRFFMMVGSIYDVDDCDIEGRLAAMGYSRLCDDCSSTTWVDC